MDGLELLRAVREYDLDVPVILMTGGPDDAAAPSRRSSTAPFAT